MRHISAVIFLVLALVVPWLMSQPEKAQVLFSTIQQAGDGLASVILSHNPKTVAEIKANYNDKRELFESNRPAKKVKILLVPGHEPNYGGAEYGSLKEREMTVELADGLKEFLSKNSRYEVFVARSKESWSPTFQNYFTKEWKDIVAWKDGHKSELEHLTKAGDFHPTLPSVIHNSAPTDVALRLYGLGKWANENDVDIILHIHFNDYPGHGNLPGKYSGLTIYVPQKQYFNSATTQSLAKDILKRLNKYNPISNLPGESAGIVQDQNLIAIGAYNSVDAASMLIEYGYIYEPQFTNSNIHDTAIKDLAFQTYLGLQDFLDNNSALSSSGYFDTLVMPYTWNKPIADNKANANDVYALQTALVFDGVYPPQGKTFSDCPRTGSVGACTVSAIEDFQNRRGIRGEKGVAGRKTLEELNKSFGVKAI